MPEYKPGQRRIPKSATIKPRTGPAKQKPGKAYGNSKRIPKSAKVIKQQGTSSSSVTGPVAGIVYGVATGVVVVVAGVAGVIAHGYGAF